MLPHYVIQLLEMLFAAFYATPVLLGVWLVSGTITQTDIALALAFAAILRVADVIASIERSKHGGGAA